MQNKSVESPDTIKAALSIPEINSSARQEVIIKSIVNGSVLIHIEGYSQVIMANIPKRESRSLSTPENESQVIGAQVGFNESLSTNISLIRRYIVSPDLCNEQFVVGKRTNTSVALLYIERDCQ